MAQVINAIYEDGVFKPLQEVDLKEHEKVEIKILPDKDWERRFNAVLKRIHEETRKYPQEEVETDIEKAVKEVRAK